MKHTPMVGAPTSIDLDDCGKVVDIYHRNLGYSFKKRIEVVIKAPRGTMVIYESNQSNDNIKGEAIKAFMEARKYG